MPDQPQKLDLKSMDVTEEKKQQFKQLFPEVFRENEIDFDHLKRVLSKEWDVDSVGKERFGLQWPGKTGCMKIIQQPSIATLKPDREESVNFEDTENLFIEGDNLEVLKLLQKSYFGKVKMIYIDPPYNTGNEFIYPDNYSESLGTYLRYTGQKDEEGNWQTTNRDTDGRFHSRWLNMMYPRLFLAKNLLHEDGIIMINIGDEEIANLKGIVNELYGEENFIGNLIWEKKKKGTFLSGHLTNIKDHILVYAKNKEKSSGLIGEINTDVETYPCINDSNNLDTRRIPAGIKSKFKQNNYQLEEGEIISEGSMEIKLLSDLKIEDHQLAEDVLMESNWRYRQEAIDEYAKERKLYITEDLYIRRIVDHPREKTLKDLLLRKTNKKKLDLDDLNSSTWGSNEDAKEEQMELLGMKNVMDYPKPSILITKLIKSFRQEDFIVLDFFAGSCTTAHAVLALNKLDGGNRKFINIQLPEQFDESKDTHQNAIKFCSQNNLENNFASIGKERIRRVIKQIENEGEAKQDNQAELELEEESEEKKDLDLGFKVFKLKPSNFKVWDAPDIDTQADELEEQLDVFADHITPEAEQESILYELILKSGFPLTTPVHKKEIDGKTVYSIQDGALLIYLDDGLTFEMLDQMAEMQPQRVVCLDQSFTGDEADALKTNAVQLFKSQDIAFRTV
jgi:adenine-specific DNA-methyltransferase